MGKILNRATQRVTLAHVRHVVPVPPAQAGVTVHRVYDQVIAEFGILAPPVALHSPAPELLAACWMMLREGLIADGQASRASKEVVAASVSLANTCPYCVDVHGAALHGLIAVGDAKAVAADRLAGLGDPELRDLAAWARHSTGGSPVPVPPRELPEIAGVAFTFHYLNRMVNVFLPDSPLPADLLASARPVAQWIATKALGSMARKGGVRPGRSLDLLPATTTAADLGWATGGGAVEDAFARATAAIDDAGERCVAPAVRRLVTQRLDDWDGTDLGIGSGWLGSAVASLPASEQAAGRLALLTAFASYQVTAADVTAVIGTERDDTTVLGLTAWASLAAARRTLTRMTAHGCTTAPS